MSNLLACIQWRIQGEGPGGPDPHIRPDACLRLKFLHRKDHILIFYWLIFLMKHALHFATNLNSRDIQTCNCLLLPSYALFASFCLYSRWSISRANSNRHSQIEKHVAVFVRSNMPQKSPTVPSEPKFGPPNQKFLDLPLVLVRDNHIMRVDSQGNWHKLWKVKITPIM